MPAEIHITINADCPEDLLHALQTLNNHLNAQDQHLVTTSAAKVEDGTVEATVEDTPTRPRKTTKKKAAPANDQKEDDSKGDASVTDNLVQDMTPQDTKEQANKLMQDFFLKDGERAMGEVTKLQAKYKVKQFSDVPLDRASEFLADVKLATSNNSEAAA